jgi:hypothetical protein
MVALMVAIHAWAAPETRKFNLLALVFMGPVAGLTFEVIGVDGQAVLRDISPVVMTTLLMVRLAFRPAS